MSLPNYHLPFHNEGYADGQKDALSVNPELLQEFRKIDEFDEEERSSIIWGLILDSPFIESYTKFEALGGFTVPTGRSLEINLNEFYALVDGSLVEKGFCDKHNAPRMDWEYSEFLSWIYYEAWYLGFKSVLDQIEKMMIQYHPFKVVYRKSEKQQIRLDGKAKVCSRKVVTLNKKNRKRREK